MEGHQPSGSGNVALNPLKPHYYDSYYSSFPAFNDVARAAVVKAKGFVIPHIWEYTLPHYRQHVQINDSIHFCIYTTYSIPAMWNTILFKYLKGAAPSDDDASRQTTSNVDMNFNISQIEGL